MAVRDGCKDLALALSKMPRLLAGAGSPKMSISV